MQGKKVVVHPLVLLSVLDHYTRVDNPRVCGIVLGTIGDAIHITDSFAVPFDEDTKNNVWLFDTSFQRNMFDLFKKIHTHEGILGWYHSGSSLHRNDYQITVSFTRLVNDPMMLVVNVDLEDGSFPVEVYQIRNGDFVPVSSCIEAEEAEEVGVEHLIRDINRDSEDMRKSELKESLLLYEKNIEVIENYLDDLINGKISKNHRIISCLQECLSFRPHMSADDNSGLIECYSSELIRSVVAMNDLRRNRKE